ncbi:hypothetical protein S7335_1972 [Synechococcus sp. PCC 7335]|nr:hypothetical protein S7335_1972 [Synechococcus sp. PCC 7335]
MNRCALTITKPFTETQFYSEPICSELICSELSESNRFKILNFRFYRA